MPQQYDSTHSNVGLTLSGSPLLTATYATGTGHHVAYCTEYVSASKYYWQIDMSAVSGASTVGIGNSSAAVADGNIPGDDTNGGSFQPLAGLGFCNGAITVIPSLPGPLYALEWDVVGKLLWISDVTNAPGVYYGASTSPGNPVAGTGGMPLTAMVGTSWTPGTAIQGGAMTVRFASASWTGDTPQSGFGPFDVSGGGGGGGGLLLFGGSIMCGWTPPSLPFLGAAAAWKAGQAVRRNATLSRRALIGKR